MHELRFDTGTVEINYAEGPDKGDAGAGAGSD
jgi:hypothetical protein